jgi:hypothetical protein
LPAASPGPASPPPPPPPPPGPPSPPIAWFPVRVQPKTRSVPWTYTAPPSPAAPPPLPTPAPPRASPFVSVRSLSVRSPASVTRNSRNSTDPNRVIVCPVPWMVTGLVTTRADGPALLSGAVVSSMVARSRDGAKSMVSGPGAAFAWASASLRLPRPESAMLDTVKVAGVERSSSRSRPGRSQVRRGRPRRGSDGFGRFADMGRPRVVELSACLAWARRLTTPCDGRRERRPKLSEVFPDRRADGSRMGYSVSAGVVARRPRPAREGGRR